MGDNIDKQSKQRGTSRQLVVARTSVGYSIHSSCTNQLMNGLELMMKYGKKHRNHPEMRGLCIKTIVIPAWFYQYS